MPDYTGVYALTEASRYLYVTTPARPPRYSALRRWVRSGLPSLETASAPRKDLFLTFEDLVSLRMIVALRQAGFTLQHIRRVHQFLQDITHYYHPFALKDLWISETDIFIEMESFMQKENLLSATRRGQYAMDFIREWLRHIRRPVGDSLDLSFKRTNGWDVASAWSPHPYVVLNPMVQFGSPCIEETRIPTRSVWSMFLGGDRPETIARGYGIPISKVQCVLEWERGLAGITTR